MRAVSVNYMMAASFLSLCYVLGVFLCVFVLRIMFIACFPRQLLVKPVKFSGQPQYDAVFVMRQYLHFRTSKCVSIFTFVLVNASHPSIETRPRM